MRVALVTETFLPKIDGIVSTLGHLLCHLAERGHESLLVAPEGGPETIARTRVVSLPWLPCPLYPELRLVSPHVDLTPTLSAFRPNLVHVLNPVSLGVAGLRAAQALGVPTVASYHTDLAGFAAKWGMSWASEVIWAAVRWVHNQADLNLCPSRHTAEELREHGVLRVDVWGRGVDAKHYRPERRSFTWRRRLSGGVPDAPLLLFVGRLSPEKRVDWLQAVLEARPDARLAVVGDGPARGVLERQLDPRRTTFTGYLTGNDLANAYAAADVFVFPAANETLGNVVLEAMASGLAVVAANSGGVRDHVRSGVNGLLFDADDPSSLVRRVCTLLEAPALAEILARRGRRYAELLTWERVLDGLITDYETVAGSGRLIRAA